MPVDPLAEIVTLLQPKASFSKLVEYADAWRIHPEIDARPFYCAVLEGQCRMSAEDRPPMILRAGDFLLAPATRAMTLESIAPPPRGVAMMPVEIGEGRFRVGPPEGAPNLRMQVGLCSFASPDAALLVSLLPTMVIAHGEPRLATLTQLVSDETRRDRPARELVLERLLEVLLIEALRTGAGTASAPGLGRGLADNRLAGALRAIHARPEHRWTVAGLAAEAAMSRSAFFARFKRVVGLAPMEYLLAWRMALAKRLLRTGELAIALVAARIGYGSASTFSTAFARHVGMPPARFARIAHDGRPAAPGTDRGAPA
ncbi:helix-turn-helix transcriptional regulator [Stakelama tenebrarum]|uniref:AraC family transcriptional regulator n=1 Tax=Stakelama tenebrarum TaxID=2711215 RepID=A0A6G6Y1I4_9SPHN|nr:AraC family transcriptional regulator [Sphingosinithalassobacter tenebrarum]QIG78759.1 AraC family transcriptional regulator [Sphingosinithalassobacter tenebrarum]